MSYEIYKSIPRSPDDVKKTHKLASFGVATISDVQSGRGLMDPSIKPIRTGRSIGGKAITVECIASDNLMVHSALEFCKQGDVLVVTTPKRSFHGFFGELMATSAIAQGAIGLIMDGGIRDASQISDLGFYVSTRYISAQKTGKNTPGNVNKPIICGDVKVNPGDFIVADDDGVVVVPWEKVDDVIELANKKIESEKESREKLARGELSVNLNSLKQRLVDLGVNYVEGEY